MSRENEATIEAPVVEETVTEQTGKFDGMSNRDALAKAIEEKRDVQPTEDVKPEPKPEVPTKTEVKAAVEADIEAPSEFSAVGKKAWKEKDVLGIQKEFRRIHDARTQELSRAQTEERKAREEHKTYRDLAKMADPYIKARGDEGVPPEKAIMEALALINQFKSGDPVQVKAELKKIGIDLDKAPEGKTSGAIPDEIKAEIKTLHETTQALLKEREEQTQQKIAQTFQAIFQELGSQKNRTGESVFPDLLDNSEEGKQFAFDLGSRTHDPQFQKWVLRRFPDADLKVVIREAYKSLGGRVSGEAVQVSQSNQKHIEKSRRAAASTPGRAISRNDSSNLVGKLSNRAALARALEESREH